MAYEEMHWDDDDDGFFFIFEIFSLFMVELANGNLCFISYYGLTLIVFLFFFLFLVLKRHIESPLGFLTLSEVHNNLRHNVWVFR